MQPFPAKYNGLCNPCGEDIKPGEFIIAHPDAGFIHEECTEYIGKVSQDDAEDPERSIRDRTARPVLPRGKTAKDRCNKCFIIHTVGQGDQCE